MPTINEAIRLLRLTELGAPGPAGFGSSAADRDRDDAEGDDEKVELD